MDRGENRKGMKKIRNYIRQFKRRVYADWRSIDYMKDCCDHLDIKFYKWEDDAVLVVVYDPTEGEDFKRSRNDIHFVWVRTWAPQSKISWSSFKYNLWEAANRTVVDAQRKYKIGNFAKD